jgi:hypothetical protein
LEERRVPSTLPVTSILDDVTQRGTLRYAVAHATSGDTILMSRALKGAPIVLSHGELLLTRDVTIEAILERRSIKAATAGPSTPSATRH